MRRLQVLGVAASTRTFSLGLGLSPEVCQSSRGAQPSLHVLGVLLMTVGLMIISMYLTLQIGRPRVHPPNPYRETSARA